MKWLKLYVENISFHVEIKTVPSIHEPFSFPFAWQSFHSYFKLWEDPSCTEDSALQKPRKICLLFLGRKWLPFASRRFLGIYLSLANQLFPSCRLCYILFPIEETQPEQHVLRLICMFTILFLSLNNNTVKGMTFN